MLSDRSRPDSEERSTQHCRWFFLRELAVVIEDQVKQIAEGTHPSQTEAGKNEATKSFAASTKVFITQPSPVEIYEGVKERLYEALEMAEIGFDRKGDNYPTAMIISPFPKRSQDYIKDTVKQLFDYNTGYLGVIFVLIFNDAGDPTKPTVQVWRSSGLGYPEQTASGSKENVSFRPYTTNGSQKPRAEGHCPELVSCSTEWFTLELRDLVRDDENRRAILDPESQTAPGPQPQDVYNQKIHIPASRLGQLMKASKVYGYGHHHHKCACERVPVECSDGTYKRPPTPTPSPPQVFDYGRPLRRLTRSEDKTRKAQLEFNRSTAKKEVATCMLRAIGQVFRGY